MEEIGEGEIELTCVDKKREVDKEGIRRKKCDVPEDLEFKTKPQLALEMLHGLQDDDTFPCWEWINMNSENMQAGITIF